MSSNKQLPPVTQLKVAEIRPFIRRAREEEGFQEMKAAIKEVGLKIPIQVRDISDQKPERRKRPDGGHYRYQLICGQGRMEAHRQLKMETIPAYVLDVSELELVGRFLAENMIRKPLPWAEKARLVKADLDAGMSTDKVAKKFFISPKHALKYERILSKTAPELESEVTSLPIAEAEKLVTLPAGDQSIVMEVMRETGERQVRALVNKALEIKDESGGKLSKSALKASLSRVDEDLKRLRDKLKLTRLHDALGPQSLLVLLRDRKFKNACEKEGINVGKFLQIVEQAP